ncbi:molybdopterin-dependent oxidoreductase [Ferrimonas kyonanensis]|uniref:molybdopterin-dependent oxidoreductase n=1 Tax=Ferrimonas kyonanensis TaxID=364763 RepID=UPI000400F0FD|nr:molybdopterin-dependent oxidoreductase [Ferrimonas kyonanensis]
MQRRDFLKLSATAGAVSCVTACGGKSGESVTPPTAPEVKEVESITLCETNCSTSCAFKVISVDGRIVRIEPEDVTTAEKENMDIRQMRPCAKGNSAKQKIYSPDRVLTPLKRTGPRGSGQYEEISWEQAYREIGDKLQQLQAAHGPKSIYRAAGSNYGGSHSAWWVDNLLNASGGFLAAHNAMSFSQVYRAMEISYGVHGHARDWSSTVEIQNSDFILGFGNNPLETLASGSGNGFEFNHLLKGKPFVNFDLRYNDTNLGREQEFHFIRPGTDAALIQGMAHELITKGWVKKEWVKKKCYGFYAEPEMDSPTQKDADGNPVRLPEVPAEECYQGHILGLKDGIPKTPEWAEKICGVPAEVIRSTAKKLYEAKAPYVVAGWGLQRQLCGEDNVRSVTVLAAMVGAIGNRGNSTGEHADAKGYIYPMPLMDFAASARWAVQIHSWPRAIKNGTTMSVLKDNIHLPADEIDPVTGDGVLGVNMKAIFNRGGNPFNQQADNHKILELLKDENDVELIVSIDTHLIPSMYVNDYVLPDFTQYEREDLAPTNMQSGTMGFIVGTSTALTPMGNVKSTFEICLGIAKHMGIEAGYTMGLALNNDEDALNSVYNFTRNVMRPDLQQYMPETFKEMQEKGIVKWARPCNETEESARFHVGYWDYVQKDDIHLHTPSGKIDIYSHYLRDLAEKTAKVYEDTDGVPEYWLSNAGGYINTIPKYMVTPESVQDESEHLKDYPLQFVTYHTKSHVHVQYQGPWMKEALRSGAWINEQTAQELGIKDDDMIVIESIRGKTKVEARVTNRIAPGVVALGQGRHFKSVAGVDQGGSANALTSHEYNSPIEKASGVANCRCKVAKA